MLSCQVTKNKAVLFKEDGSFFIPNVRDQNSIIISHQLTIIIIIKIGGLSLYNILKPENIVYSIYTGRQFNSNNISQHYSGATFKDRIQNIYWYLISCNQCSCISPLPIGMIYCS